MDKETVSPSGTALSDYERPSVTADIAAFTIRSEKNDSYRRNPSKKLSLLLIKRGCPPYLNAWALPGGFLHPDETVECCAMREIREETNITPSALFPVAVFSEPHRDPRGWVISHLFAGVISDMNACEKGGDDADEARWFTVKFTQEEDGLHHLTLQNGEITIQALLRKTQSKFGNTDFEIADSGTLAFDHAGMIATAISALRTSAGNIENVFDYLPEEFTLTALQTVQETITDTTVLTANFRRKIADYVEETDAYVSGGGHRPAKLYRRKNKTV